MKRSQFSEAQSRRRGNLATFVLRARQIKCSMLWSKILVVSTLAGAILCVGLLISRFRAETGAQAAHVSSKVAEGEVSLEEFRAFVERGEAVVVDARPEVLHRLGHVPGASSLPVKDFKASYAKHRSRLEADKGALVVIYCSGVDCEDSTLVRKALGRQGHTRIVIFKGGWDAWTEAGYPVERDP